MDGIDRNRVPYHFVLLLNFYLNHLIYILMLFRPHVGKIRGLNTCYTELENCYEIFQGKASKKCHGRTFWASWTDKNVYQCYFLKISRKLKQKYINVLGSIFESKKKVNDSVFFTVQFLTYDLLKLSNLPKIYIFNNFYISTTIFQFLHYIYCSFVLKCNIIVES